MNDSNSSYWNKLKSDFMEYVKREILKPQGEYKRYTRSVDLLIEYAEANGYNEYSPEVGMAFYESEKAHGYKGYSTLGYWRLPTFLTAPPLTMSLRQGTRKPRCLSK